MQRTLSYVLLLVPVSSAPSPTPNLVPALRALTLVPAGLPTTQVGALEAIYDATSGTRWRYGRAGAMWSFASNSMKTRADPCLAGWAGVRCDSKNSSVIALDVSSMGLVGTLPEKIGALTALTYLDATNNSLSGILPAGLFLLTMLHHLQIESNLLEGSLPESLGQLKALTFLSLFDNMLEGTLSTTIGLLKALNELYLSRNILTGSLPVELFELTELYVLSLKSNNLEGTLSPSVGQLTVLTGISLHSNSLSGTLPVELFQLTSLRDLRLYSNRFEGTLSTTIGLLKVLTRLDLYFNRLAGSLPVEMFDLTELKSLSLNNNKFDGSLSPAVGKLKVLTMLDLSLNSIAGSLPIELFQLTALQTLRLYYNKFLGTLSPDVGLLKDLTGLYLFSNRLSGSLPVELFELTTLIYLRLSYNKFQGTLSPAVGQLKALTRLDLSSNSLSGFLPSSMFKITTLKYLGLDDNNFQGTLSSLVGDLQVLTGLSLFSNFLSGSLPVEMFEITTLRFLSLKSNQFKGTLSPAVGYLKDLTRLDLYSNWLSGSLPVELFELTALSDLSLDVNNFQGTLSPQVGQLKALSGLSLHSNSLSGSLPSELYQLTALNFLRLSQNMFHGSLLSMVGQLKELTALVLYSNCLSGSLPLELFELTALSDLSIDVNDFQGTLSPQVAKLKGLSAISLHSNRLSGSLPSELFEITTLNELKLYKNHFYGSLPLINASMISFLNTLDVSNNALTGCPPLWLSSAKKLVNFSIANNSFSSSTLDFLPSANVINVDISGNFLGGTLPVKIFRDSPGLKRFVAASNCLSGSVPIAICEATSLETLILDGLSSGKRCTAPLFVPSQLFPHPGTKTLSKIQGGLPACLYSSLPNITTLHVSGNGLTGRAFPSSVSRWPLSLVDLSLSHNRLTGPISADLQSGLAQFKTFDVANNRLDGLLSNVQLNNATKANLVVNRFSGPLSKSTVAASVVQVLEGNLIGCSSLNRNSQLPTKDPYFHRFSCGSNTFDVSLAVFAAIVFALAGIAMTRFRVSWFRVYQQLIVGSATAVPSVDTISCLVEALHRIGRICACFIAILVVVCIPTYAAVSASFKTHSDLYSWSVSATFVGGVAPAVFYLVLWTIILFVWDWALIDQSQSKSSLKTKKSFGTISGLFSVAALRKAAAQAAVFTFNAFFVVIANVSYVVIVKNGSNEEQKLAGVALTLFKLLWNRVVLSLVVKQTQRISASASSSQGSLLKLEVLLAAFNIVVAPVIALLTADSHCFGQAFTAPSPVTTSYDYFAGSDYANVKWDTQDKEWKSPAILATAYISYQPSFRYGYGCSSALVTTYASVFVNMALFSCVAGPLWLVTVRNLIDREWLSKDFGAWFLPALIQTSQERQIRFNAASTAMGFLSSGKLGAHSSNKKIVDTPAMFLEIMQDLLALLTFGLVAPMCGLAIAVALIVKLLAFRYALELFRSTQPAEDVEALSADCNDFSQHAHPFVETHPIILMLSSLFLSAFLVDIAGDAVGLNDAMWAPALMWILPLLLSQLRAQFFASSPSTRVACNSPTASPAEVELPGAYRGSVFDLQSTYNSTGPSSCSQQTTVDIPNPILLRGSHKFASATANSEAEQLFDPSAWKTPSAAEGVLGGSAAAAFSEQHHKDSIPGPIDSELRDSPLTPVSPADSIDTLATIASAVDHSLAPRYPPPLLDLHPAGSLSSIPIEVTPASLPP